MSGQLASINVLVFGWYGHDNLGDQLFCEAFKQLFPHINFTFSDVFTTDNVKDVSAIFIGGGSFLFADPLISEECLNIIKTKMIFYVGVGVETAIHPVHKDLMKLAGIIAVRSVKGIEKVKSLNNVVVIPDLVYSLKAEVKSKISNSVLILPNISVIPQNTDDHWKHNSWQHFKFEFGQFLDYLVESGYDINFFSMCNSYKQNDDWAAYEIIAGMRNRNDYIIRAKSSNIKDITKLFSRYETIITQRFHGIILSELVRTPYISIFHHDKLNHSFLNECNFISYYSSSKQTFIDQFNLVKNIKLKKNISIELNIFESLKNKINHLLSEV